MATNDPPQPTNWREIFTITAAGAVGGLLGWFISQTSAGLDTHWFLTLVTAILGGLVAGGVGVYVVASTDTTKLARAIFFAVLCGISWQPVLDAGKTLVVKAATSQAVSSAQDQIQNTIAATKSNAAPTDAEIRGLTNSTVMLANKLPSITDVTLQNEARQSAFSAIRHFGVLAKKKPEESVNSLVAIGRQASSSGSPHIEAAVIQELGALSKDPQAGPAQTKAAAALQTLQ